MDGVNQLSWLIVFDVLGLKQLVMSLACSNPEHLLDVLVTDPSLTVREVHVDEAGLISDHCIIVATITVDLTYLTYCLGDSRSIQFVYKF